MCQWMVSQLSVLTSINSFSLLHLVETRLSPHQSICSIRKIAFGSHMVHSLMYCLQNRIPIETDSKIHACLTLGERQDTCSCSATLSDADLWPGTSVTSSLHCLAVCCVWSPVTVRHRSRREHVCRRPNDLQTCYSRSSIMVSVWAPQRDSFCPARKDEDVSDLWPLLRDYLLKSTVLTCMVWG